MPRGGVVDGGGFLGGGSGVSWCSGSGWQRRCISGGVILLLRLSLLRERANIETEQAQSPEAQLGVLWVGSQFLMALSAIEQG